MKKLLSLILALILTFSLAACKKDEPVPDESPELSSDESAVEEPEDWREKEDFIKMKSVNGSIPTTFLISVEKDMITVYPDREEQELYGRAILDSRLKDTDYTKANLKLVDLNKNGYADLIVPYGTDEKEVWYFIYDTSINDFVFHPEYLPEEKEDEEPEEESSDESSEETSEESSRQENKAKLYLDFSHSGGSVREIEIAAQENFGAGDAINAIAEETWLNFSLTYETYGSDIYIYWSENSTLHNAPTSLNPAYGLSDNENLRWFMLDSISTTLKKMGYSGVYYRGEAGGDLILTETDKVTVIAGDAPYSGVGTVKTGVYSDAAARKVLERSFIGLTEEGVNVEFRQEGRVDGETAYIFKISDGRDGAFGDTWFAVSATGKIYAYDPTTDSYSLYMV